MTADVLPNVRVRCHELAPRVGDLRSNLAIIDEAIARASAADVDLLVLPELATSGYYLRDAEEVHSVAMTAHDPAFARWSAAAGKMTVVVGFAESDGETIYNSAAVVNGGGVLTVYRKTHLWGVEHESFTPGSAPPPVVDTAFGRLGILICYDMEFPELPRMLALQGADIIAVPTNWPPVPRPNGEHPPEVIQAMASARSSRVAIACCDRSGVERGNDWTRGSTVIGADGWPAGERVSDDCIDAEIAIDRDRRISDYNDALGDRRPQLYRL
ncbi:nitrilase-related carbon-nitrogen hydrolase [Ruicaihuangia caeni]|uniref:nitrilase-related carbon-nitrogen hydrolase n=1 Tax=Ruicaihuangia caeni TaxID=3042517 RepID=UPI00338E1FB3